MTEPDVVELFRKVDEALEKVNPLTTNARPGEKYHTPIGAPELREACAALRQIVKVEYRCQYADSALSEMPCSCPPCRKRSAILKALGEKP